MVGSARVPLASFRVAPDTDPPPLDPPPCVAPVPQLRQEACHLVQQLERPPDLTMLCALLRRLVALQ